MKRMVAVLAVVVMLVGMVGMAVAEEKKFDWTIYEEAPGYEYDKFEKTWRVLAGYVKKYAESTLVFGITVVGNKENVRTPITLYGWWRDKDNKEGLQQITEVDILIGDNLFSCKTLLGDKEQWYVPLDSESAKEFMAELIGAEEVSIRYKYKIGSISRDMKANEILDMKELCKFLIDNNPWDFLLDGNGYDGKKYDQIIKSKWPMEISE